MGKDLQMVGESDGIRSGVGNKGRKLFCVRNFVQRKQRELEKSKDGKFGEDFRKEVILIKILFFI